MVKIYLDPGHGGSDPGAVGNGLKEKDLTLKIAKKTKEHLDKYYSGHTTRLTRTSDHTLSLNARTNMANNWGADYFLSIHINAGGGEGYEDFIFNGLSNSSKTARLRNTIHSTIAKATNWKNRGKKKANYHVLRETKMSSMLTECGFIDNARDAKKLKSNAVIDSIAVAHAEGLAKAFNLKKKASTPKKPSSGTVYKVQAGAFRDKKNAEKLAKKLKKDGYDTFIVRE